MNKTIHQYLLKKYAISNTDDDFQYGGTFSSILYRLNKNKTLNEVDKKWLSDKHMSKLLEFIQDWERRGKANFNLLHQNSSFPYKDYMSPPVKKEIVERNKKVFEYHRDIYKDDIENEPIIEVRQMKKQKTSKTKNKQTQRKTIGHNMRKSHMPLFYKKAIIDKHIENEVIDLKPTEIPEDISSVFLKKIWETINSDIQKDIKELYTAYRHQLWTATSLMAYRILENILKVHIESDLKKEKVNSITSAIKVLKENKYDSDLLKNLSEYKDERNEYMHGNKRAGAGDVKKMIGDIISITMHIHNIKP